MRRLSPVPGKSGKPGIVPFWPAHRRFTGSLTMPVQPDQSGPLGLREFLRSPRRSSSLSVPRARPAARGDFDIVISEIHYHPPLESGVDEADEFWSCKTLRRSRNLSGGSGRWDFLRVPEGAFIEPKGFSRSRAMSVICRSPRVEHAIGNFVDDFPTRATGRAQERERMAHRSRGLPGRGALAGERRRLGPSSRRKTRSPAARRVELALVDPAGARPGGELDGLRAAATTLIKEGDTWKYRKGTSEPASPIGAGRGPTSTMRPVLGPSGFGYSDGDDATSSPTWRATTPRLHPKEVLHHLGLRGGVPSPVIVHDDAFVAYLNGTEVARSASAGGPLESPALRCHRRRHRRFTSTVDLASSLRSGRRERPRIQALNSDIDSSDSR